MTWAALHAALLQRGLVHAADVPRARAAAEPVTGIAYDSRAVGPGDVFVALKGRHADGASFAREAMGRGASVVVSEAAPPDDVKAPWAAPITKS